MEDNRQYWNKKYKKLKENKLTYDLWLDNYKYILEWIFQILYLLKTKVLR